jgi:hypothetical protein
VSERPILQDDPTEVEKRLLGSARMDAPPATSKPRTLAALGFLAVETTTSGAGGAVASSVVAAGIVKWLAVGTIGGALAFGGVEGLSPLARRVVARPSAGVTRGSSSGEAQVLNSSLASVPSAIPANREGGIVSEAPAGPSSRLVAPNVVVSNVVRLGPGRLRPSPTADTTQAIQAAQGIAPLQTELAGELRALDEAHRALLSNNASATLRMLDAFERDFPRPSLGPEALLLRVEALLALGRVDIARRVAGRLLKEQPDGAYSQRVRSLLDGGPATNR